MTKKQLITRLMLYTYAYISVISLNKIIKRIKTGI